MSAVSALLPSNTKCFLSVFFFSSKFSIWKIQILYNHWWLQCSLPEKWILTQLSLVQLPQPSFCWRLPWLESREQGESCTHGGDLPSIDEYPTFSHAISGGVFCRSGLKATSESWVAPKISLKKKKKKRWNILYKELFWALTAEGQSNCKTPHHIRDPSGVNCWKRPWKQNLLKIVRASSCERWTGEKQMAEIREDDGIAWKDGRS